MFLIWVDSFTSANLSFRKYVHIAPICVNIAIKKFKEAVVVGKTNEICC